MDPTSIWCHSAGSTVRPPTRLLAVDSLRGMECRGTGDGKSEGKRGEGRHRQGRLGRALADLGQTFLRSCRTSTSKSEGRLGQGRQVLYLPRHTAYSAVYASDLSHLGARELEHDDPAMTVARDKDLVAVHNHCRGFTSQIDANSLYDVA
eukprot:scaffold81454_cov74-Phaeocystis_antarctica.AAC.1